MATIEQEFLLWGLLFPNLYGNLGICTQLEKYILKVKWLIQT